MFAKTIIDSDAFLDMPLSAQALYFHLSMRADDDGFINNPKKIQRMIGNSDDDAKLLITKQFIIPFESGIVVIKHWRIHNYIQKDRYKETTYTKEKSMLKVNDNNTYGMLDTTCIHDVYSLDTQVRLGKNRLESGENREGKKKKASPFEEYTSNESLLIALNDFLDMRKKIKAPMTDKAINLMLGKLDKLSNTDDEKIDILNQSIMNSWKGLFPIKNQPQKQSQPAQPKRIMFGTPEWQEQERLREIQVQKEFQEAKKQEQAWDEHLKNAHKDVDRRGLI
jgi:hypothetical protein